MFGIKINFCAVFVLYTLLGQSCAAPIPRGEPLEVVRRDNQTTPVTPDTLVSSVTGQSIPAGLAELLDRYKVLEKQVSDATAGTPVHDLAVKQLAAAKTVLEASMSGIAVFASSTLATGTPTSSSAPGTASSTLTSSAASDSASSTPTPSSASGSDSAPSAPTSSSASGSASSTPTSSSASDSASASSSPTSSSASGSTSSTPTSSSASGDASASSEPASSSASGGASSTPTASSTGTARSSTITPAPSSSGSASVPIFTVVTQEGSSVVVVASQGVTSTISLATLTALPKSTASNTASATASGSTSATDSASDPAPTSTTGSGGDKIKTVTMSIATVTTTTTVAGAAATPTTPAAADVKAPATSKLDSASGRVGLSTNFLLSSAATVVFGAWMVL